MYKILFVCTGNICRSPTAEGVLRHRVREAGLEGRVHIDSAGTTGYHAGEAPDRRSVAAAQRRGISLQGQRARQVRQQDFHDFDLILALDETHLRELQRIAPENGTAQLALMLVHCGHAGRDVPDPYYGQAQDFEYVLDLIESAVKPLLEKIQQQVG